MGVSVTDRLGKYLEMDLRIIGFGLFVHNNKIKKPYPLS